MFEPWLILAKFLSLEIGTGAIIYSLHKQSPIPNMPRLVLPGGWGYSEKHRGAVSSFQSPQMPSWGWSFWCKETRALAEEAPEGKERMGLSSLV